MTTSLDLNGYSSNVQALTGPLGIYQLASSGSVVTQDTVLDVTSTGPADSGALRAIARQGSGNASIRGAEAHASRTSGASPNATWGMEVGAHNEVAGADSVGLFVGNYPGWVVNPLKTKTGIRISGPIGFQNAIEILSTDGSGVFTIQLSPSPALGFVGQTTLVGNVHVIGDLVVQGRIIVST